MLEMQKVTKKIRHRYAVEDIDLHAERGNIYALIGRIGSGKSSVLKLCAGLMKADSGRILVNNVELSAGKNIREISKKIGYLGQNNMEYSHLLVLEYLEFFAHAHGEYGLSARERCMELLLLAGLERRAGVRMDTLPESEKRQLCFLQSVIHKPELLLLDEPFFGMDEKDEHVTKEIITRAAAAQTTVVFTSSTLPDVLEFCQQIGIMEEGRLVVQGSREMILSRIREKAPIYMEILYGHEKAIALLYTDPRVTSMTYDRNYFMVRFSGNQEQEISLLKKLVEAGVGVGSFHRGQGNPGDFFVS